MQYIYKGPVLEWYVKVKMNFENNYQLFNELIPKKAHIADLGCGNGMMDYMLLLCSKDRTLVGIDYDADKIQVAGNITLAQQFSPGQISFESADLNHWAFVEADVYILADVLHYMPENEQLEVLRKAAEKLRPGGKIIIRDADIDMHKKHKGTALSEWQSTKVFKFNKTKDSSKTLYFTSAATREAWMQSLGLQVKLIDQTKMNSNVVLVGEKE
jgi:2-polyprenyl-3-methyl-5-hydroxy-6-metoxy-1,4-benzoquinol methylase